MSNIKVQVPYPGTFFVVLRQDNFTIVNLFDEGNGAFVSSGVSKRHPTDQQNIPYGIALALKRAKDAIPFEKRVDLLKHHLASLHAEMDKIDAEFAARRKS